MPAKLNFFKTPASVRLVSSRTVSTSTGISGCYQPHRQTAMPGQKSIYETFLGRPHSVCHAGKQVEGRTHNTAQAVCVWRNTNWHIHNYVKSHRPIYKGPPDKVKCNTNRFLGQDMASFEIHVTIGLTILLDLLELSAQITWEGERGGGYRVQQNAKMEEEGGGADNNQIT